MAPFRTQRRLWPAERFSLDDIEVIGTTASGATVSGGTGSPNLITLDSRVFTAGVIPPADFEGTLRVRVPAEAVWTAHGTTNPEAVLEVRADTLAPALTGAAVAGNALTLAYHEPLDDGSMPGKDDFAVAVDDTARGVGGVAMSGSTVTLTLASAVAGGSTVTVTYEPPADAALRDLAGNPAAALTGRAVMNQSVGVVVSIAAERSPVTEGAGAHAVFTLQRAGSILEALTVGVSVTETASFIAGSAPSEVTFTAGAAQASLSVALDDDTVGEFDGGTITAALDDGDGYAVSITAGAAVVRVIDDDERLRVGFAAPAPEVAEGAGAVTLTVVARTAPGVEPVALGDGTVELETRAGTAAAELDFTARSAVALGIGTGDWQADGDGHVARTEVEIAILDDALHEGNESFTVTLVRGLQAPAGLALDSATVTIADDERTPRATLMLSAGTLGERGAVAAVTAALDGPSGAATTVAVNAAAVAPATAADFTLSAERTLTIAAGATASTGTVTITAVDNEADAPDKRVTVAGTGDNPLDVLGPSGRRGAADRRRRPHAGGDAAAGAAADRARRGRHGDGGARPPVERGHHGGGDRGGGGAGGGGGLHAERRAHADDRGGSHGEHRDGDHHRGRQRRGRAGQAGDGVRDRGQRLGRGRAVRADPDDRRRRRGHGDAGVAGSGRGGQRRLHGGAGAAADGGGDHHRGAGQRRRHRPDGDAHGADLTAADYADAQTVTVRAAADTDQLDGTAIFTHAAASMDPSYHGISIEPVTATEDDRTLLITRLADAEVDENTAWTSLTPMLSGADGTVTWTLAGADAGAFEIHSGTGELTLSALPDFESPGDANTDRIYELSVTATDSADPPPRGSATVTLTVTVTNVWEPPAAPAAPTVEAAGPDRLAVSWTAPDNAGRPVVTEYDLQYRVSGERDFTDGPQDVPATGTSATITGLSAGTTYQVQVRAGSDEGNGAWSAPGSGATEALPVMTIAAAAGGESVTEGADAQFTLSRTGTPGAALAVAVSVTEKGAFLDGTPPETVTFAMGATTTTLTVATAADYDLENDGSVTAEVRPGADYTAGMPATATVAVLDDEVAVDVAVTLAESVAENAALTFTLTATTAADRAPSHPFGFFVETGTVDDGATAGADFTHLAQQAAVFQPDAFEREEDGASSGIYVRSRPWSIPSPSPTTRRRKKTRHSRYASIRT